MQCAVVEEALLSRIALHKHKNPRTSFGSSLVSKLGQEKALGLSMTIA